MTSSLDANADDWRILARGLNYKRLAIIQNNSPVDLHVFRINLSRYNVKPIAAAQSATAKLMTLEQDALLTVNANFFDVDHKILGLVLKDKFLIHQTKNISWWSTLCIKDNKATITPNKAITATECHQAIQAGPRLVIDGSIPKLKESFSAKTAIGINQAGELLIAVTRNRLSITKLAEIFQAPEQKGGLACINALNLDGGSSSQIYARIGDFELDLPSIVKVPVGLAVFDK